jgi:hypothetical protein
VHLALTVCRLGFALALAATSRRGPDAFVWRPAL